MVDSAVEPGTSLENVATVTATTAEANPADNTDTADTSITGLANLSLDKQGPQTAVAGELITYTLVVSQRRPVDRPIGSRGRRTARGRDPGVGVVRARRRRARGLRRSPPATSATWRPARWSPSPSSARWTRASTPGTLLTNQANVVSEHARRRPGRTIPTQATTVVAHRGRPGRGQGGPGRPGGAAGGLSLPGERAITMAPPTPATWWSSIRWARASPSLPPAPAAPASRAGR